MADIIQNSDDDIVNMLINRNGEEVNVKISPVKDVENLRKIGVWVRDDCQGLGTLTYVDDNNRFGALGHAICEENTGCNVSIENGYLYTARIWSIIKGQKGKPGEVVGSINYGEKNNLGIIKKIPQKAYTEPLIKAFLHILTTIKYILHINKISKPDLHI